MHTKNPQKRLDAQSDFDEWANTVVATVKTHRSRLGKASGKAPAEGRAVLRRWASRMLAKIAD